MFIITQMTTIDKNSLIILDRSNVKSSFGFFLHQPPPHPQKDHSFGPILSKTCEFHQSNKHEYGWAVIHCFRIITTLLLHLKLRFWFFCLDTVVPLISSSCVKREARTRNDCLFSNYFLRPLGKNVLFFL